MQLFFFVKIPLFSISVSCRNRYKDNEWVHKKRRGYEMAGEQKKKYWPHRF